MQAVVSKLRDLGLHSNYKNVLHTKDQYVN